MLNGFITLHRKVLDNPIWKNPNLSHLLITLILLANHEEKKILFNGQNITIKRGEVVTGRNQLSDKTGINPNSLKDYLKILKNLEIITIKSTNKFSIVSLVKYNQYQLTALPQITSKTTNQTPTRHQPDTTNNNYKNYKTYNNRPSAIKL